jgi:tetratricopeptide (TPR) repeat protein
MAEKEGIREFAGNLKAGEANGSALLGDCKAAKTAASDSLREVSEGTNRRSAAVALSLCGDAAEAQKLIDAELKDRPSDAILKYLYAPLVKAMNDITKGNSAEAIAALESARRFELAITPMNPAYSVSYVRGLAYSKMKDGEKAAAEFQKILDNPGRGPLSLLIPLAHLQMARALAMKGDAAGTKKAYQDFLAMWKDADPDLPALVQAKAEYRRITISE